MNEGVVLPKVSVIMPAYKTREWIAKSITSVVEQSFSDWELIVIDDGSPDNVFEIVNDFVNEDNRIRIIRQENQGVSVARNQGMAAARGKYITFLDSDDLYHPDFLLKLFERLEECGADFVYCGFFWMKDNLIVGETGIPYAEGDLVYGRGLKKQIVWINSLMISKDFIAKHKIAFTPGCTCAQDIEFSIKVFTLGTGGVVKAPLCYYCHRNESITHRRGTGRKLYDEVAVQDRISCFLEEFYYGEYKREILHFFSNERKKCWTKKVWRELKNGNFEAVQDFLHGYEVELKNDMNGKDLIKGKIIYSRNRVSWKIVAVLHKLKLI